MPPAEPDRVEISRPERGQIRVDVRAADGAAIRGIPVEVDVISLDGALLSRISAMSGEMIRIDVVDELYGAPSVFVTELLSGKNTALHNVESPATPAAKRAPVVAKFLDRKSNPVVVALTASQLTDPAMEKVAQDLANRFREKGRVVRVGVASPKDVVESLQPLKSPHRYPQWKTAAADLVLFGTPRDNVLILDQLRGEIFPADFAVPPAGQGRVIVTKSAFVGECDVLNVVAVDAAGAAAALAE
jgi:hypothetical protein